MASTPANASASTPEHASAYPSHAARRLARYLRAEARRAGGDLYVTPDAVAREVGRSRAEIRTLLVRLGNEVPGLTVDPQAAGPDPAWRVSVL